jgi:potassium voltage-gated channel Eag-related subfamily H protein 2/potassium voltage-gated channel Eag-related subfamily H protein 7
MALFIVDMVKQFSTKFASPKTGLMIAHRWGKEGIVQHYLRGSFLMDLVSTIPWDLLGTGSGASTRLIRLLRLTKLVRILHVSAFVTFLMKESSIKMSTWAFLKYLLLTIAVVHWCACVWMLAGLMDEENGWKSVYTYIGDTEGASPQAYTDTRESGGASERRELRAIIGSAQSGDGRLLVGLSDWYFLCVEFTLASLGIWPFTAPQPQTAGEKWLSVFFVFVAATVYAWLAGVIVELVSRQGEVVRNVDSIFDGLIDYMNYIQFPKSKRQNFLRFFLAGKAVSSPISPTN